MKRKINQQNAQINSGLICAFCWFIYVFMIILPCISGVPGWNLSKGTVNTDRLFVVLLGSSKFQNNKLHRATTAYSHILVTVSFIITLPTDAK